LIDTSYKAFLERKAQNQNAWPAGDTKLPGFLFDFQRVLVEWALLRGKSGIFADCGLGKTPMQLAWADSIVQRTNRPVLILTPLAVGSQTLREGAKFGIDCHRATNATPKGIVVANYERLHHFNPTDFAGIVCDESSILKSFDGIRKAQIVEFLRQIPQRLLCTATAAPNDYIELGNSAEALGEMGYMDMLTRFFINDQRTNAPNRLWQSKGWRFKGHAEQPFWKWVCTWARAMRRPSDLGFSDDRFMLPALEVKETVVAASAPREGMLFDIPAVGWQEEKEARRRTIPERCAAAAALVDTKEPAVIWCHLNDEADLLAKLIPGAKQVSGADSDESKEAKFDAFRTGELRVLITKPKIGAWGLNWQHCAHVVYFISHSYESYYQAIRRCWRFGQSNPVTVDLIRTDSESRIAENLQRKEAAADRMFNDLISNMMGAMPVISTNGYHQSLEVPTWM
jgi:hypothetical protein